MTRPDNAEHFEQKYAVSRGRAERRIEEAALGQAVGVNGYTTVAEAQTLCDHLALTPNSALLDVGAGRGWPGAHVARASGCRSVSTDMPWDALLTAQARGVTEVVAAHGETLPFGRAVFDGVVHADVLC